MWGAKEALGVLWGGAGWLGWANQRVGVFPVPGKRDLALNRPWSTPAPISAGLSGQACFGHLPGWSSAGKDHDSIHLSIAGEINTDPGEFRAPADSEFGPGARWTGASGGRPGYHVFY